MTEQIKIVSYFSLPTDLAGEMRGWEEFVAGEGYTVDLKDSKTGEVVAVRYIETGEAFDHVVVNSETPGELFDRVIGRVIRSLSKHSDNLMVDNI